MNRHKVNLTVVEGVPLDHQVDVIVDAWNRSIIPWEIKKRELRAIDIATGLSPVMSGRPSWPERDGACRMFDN